MTTRFPLTQGEQSYLPIQWDSLLHNLPKKSKGKQESFLELISGDFFKSIIPRETNSEVQQNFPKLYSIGL